MKLVMIGGSLRKDSLNRSLMGHLAGQLEAKGHEVTVFEGDDLRLPLYEDDVMPPPEALKMQQAMLSAQGLVVVSPEYNQGIPGHLKNAIDWLSTLSPSPWQGLPVLLCSASPGAFGGARAMASWRATLGNMGAMALPASLNVPFADQNLQADGAPKDVRTVGLVAATLEGFLDLATKLQVHA